MSIAEEVLSTLKDDDVWYFAKQDASFDNVYQAVRLFDNALRVKVHQVIIKV